MKTLTIIDPPSGWQHGFPKSLPENWTDEDFSLKDWLLVQGYPQNDINLALKHSRYWTKEIEE